MPKRSAVAVAADQGFSFANLSIEDTVVEKDNSTPFDDALWASYETRNDETPTAKSVTVPAQYAKPTVNLIRKAAGNLGVGVTVKTADAPGGNVTVTFQGKDRKQTRSSVNGVDVQDDAPDNDTADTYEYADES